MAALALTVPGESRAERALRVALGLVALVGLGVASYLTYAHYAHGGSIACPIGGSSCTTVQQSDYAELLSIPVAVLGLGAYVALLAAALLAGSIGRALGLLVAVISFCFSTWLTYVELFIIDAICAWCVTSAILMTISLLIAAWRALLPDPGAPGASGGGGSPGAGGDVRPTRDEAGVGQP